MALDIFMTHLETGGTAYASLEAYRNVWWPRGWRSDDDPGFEGVDATVLNAVSRPSGFGAGWLAARSEAATRPLIAHWWGDSISVGDDASVVDASGGAAVNTWAQKDAWRDHGMVGVFNARMQARFGDGGSGHSPFGLAVTTGSWSSNVGACGTEFRASGAASAEFRVRGDTIKVRHRNANMTAGEFRYQVDGGGWTNVVPPTGFGVDPGTATVAGLDPVEHVVRIEWVSGTIGINGVEGIITGPGTGFRTQRIALHGLAANQITDYPVTRRVVTCAVTSGSPTLTASVATFTAADVGSLVVGTGITAIGLRITAVTSATEATMSDNATSTQAATNMTISTGGYPPSPATGALVNRRSIAGLTIDPAFAEGLGQADIVVFALGVNDPSNTRHVPAALIEAFSGIARRYTGMANDDSDRTPEFVVVVNHLGKWFDTQAVYPSYVAALYDAARGVNGTVVDMWKAGRRSHRYMADRQYWSGTDWSNSVHLSRFGHARVGNTVANLFP